MRIRMGWQAAAAGAAVGAIFVVHDLGAAAIDSAEGIARILGSAAVGAIVFGIIGYAADLWRQRRSVRRSKNRD
jgi:hypothetical protein